MGHPPPGRAGPPDRGLAWHLGLTIAGSIATTLAVLAAGLFFLIDSSPIGLVLLSIPPLVLIGVTVAAALGRRAAPPAVADTRSAALPTGRDWADARERFDRLRADYAAYECDAMSVLRLPALADVSVPSTARFVDAFAEAQALATDHHPGSDHAARFTAAADGAGRAWQAAKDAAQRIRLSRLAAHERSAVERVLKLLTTAQDSDNEPERLAAYAMARAELARLDRAGVVHVPLPAMAAIDEAARGQLPGRPSGS